MNIIGILKPKYSTTYLEDTDYLREGLEVMRESRYTAVPVINNDGKYVGVISEGDFLWTLLEKGEQALHTYQIKDIIRENYCLPIKEGEEEDVLVQRALQQNFVPMVDDRDCYIGIITRRDFIQNILQKKVDSRYIISSNVFTMKEK